MRGMFLNIWQTRQDKTCGGPALRSNLTGFGPPGEDICDWGEATWQVLNIFLVSFHKSGCVVGSQVVFSEVRLFSTSSPPSSLLPSASGWWSPTSGFWTIQRDFNNLYSVQLNFAWAIFRFQILKTWCVCRAITAPRRLLGCRQRGSCSGSGMSFLFEDHLIISGLLQTRDLI